MDITIKSTVGINFLNECPSFMGMLKAQKEIKKLHSDIFDISYEAFLFPKLEELEFCNSSRHAVRGNKRGNLFIVASPNLKSLSIRFVNVQNNNCITRFMKNFLANQSLESITVDSAQYNHQISHENLRLKFPSLKKVTNNNQELPSELPF
jgi:hypothetical protein